MSISLVMPVGSIIPLDCTSDGRPKPTVVWYQDGREFKGRRRTAVKKNGQVLRINKAKVEDSGKYTCNASNAVGGISRTYALHVLGAAKAQRVQDGAPYLFDKPFTPESGQFQISPVALAEL